MKKAIIIIAVILILGAIINPATLVPGKWEKADICGYRTDIGDGTIAIKVAVNDNYYWFYEYVSQEEVDEKYENNEPISVKITKSGKIVDSRFEEK